METFFSFLEKRIDDTSSSICVGLDPHLDDLQDQTAESAYHFCLNLVKKTSKYAAAFKPNAAFFEVFGSEGWGALKMLVEAIQDESVRQGSRIPVILDAKRGDISSTAEAYAVSAFEKLGVDAITLSPYLGKDSLSPFLSYPEKGVFLLCKTSNPGSADIQDLRVAGRSLYEHIAMLAQTWNVKNNIGLVVGATHPEALQKARKAAPDLWFLAPGVGSQGADLVKAVECGLRKDGSGLLINISRGISRSEDPLHAVMEWRDQLVNIRRAITHKPPSPFLPGTKGEIADELLASGCIRFGEFTLKSGLISPIYIDLRKLASFPDLLSKIADAYQPVLGKLSFNRLAGLPYAALPIVSAISLQSGLPFVYPRKETKSYGTGLAVEGDFIVGETVVVIDDLATTGGSKFEAIEILTQAGLVVKDVVVLIDRQSGAKDALLNAGYQMHAIFDLHALLNHWAGKKRISDGELKAVRQFLAEN